MAKFEIRKAIGDIEASKTIEAAEFFVDKDHGHAIFTDDKNNNVAVIALTPGMVVNLVGT